MNSDCFRVLRQRLMEKLDLVRELSDEEILEEIDDLLLNGTQEEALSLREKIALRQELFYSVRKLDVLQELIDDNTVTEIMVNGPDHIFVERAGKLRKWEKGFTSREKLEDVIQQIVGRCNRVINHWKVFLIFLKIWTVREKPMKMECPMKIIFRCFL